MIANGDLYLGDIAPGERQVVISALVVEPSAGCELTYLLEWQDASGESREELASLDITAQAPTVDWDDLDALRAYPQKAVRDEAHLAGRATLMRELEVGATGAEVGKREDQRPKACREVVSCAIPCIAPRPQACWPDHGVRRREQAHGAT